MCFPAKTPPSREVSPPTAHVAMVVPRSRETESARRAILLQLLHEQVIGVVSSALTHHTLFFFFLIHSKLDSVLGLQPLGSSALESMDNHEYRWKQVVTTISYFSVKHPCSTPMKKVFKSYKTVRGLRNTELYLTGLAKLSPQ